MLKKVMLLNEKHLKFSLLLNYSNFYTEQLANEFSTSLLNVLTQKDNFLDSHLNGLLQAIAALEYLL